MLAAVDKFKMADAPQAAPRGDGLVSKVEQLEGKLDSLKADLTDRLNRMEKSLEEMAKALDNVQRQGLVDVEGEPGQAPAANEGRRQRYDPPGFHYGDRIWAPAPQPIGRGQWAVEGLRIWWDAVAGQRALVQRGGVLAIAIIAVWCLPEQLWLTNLLYSKPDQTE